MNLREVIGIHTYGSEVENFACPMSPNIINAFADVVQNHPSLPDEINYVTVDTPGIDPDQPLDADRILTGDIDSCPLRLSR